MILSVINMSDEVLSLPIFLRTVFHRQNIIHHLSLLAPICSPSF